MLKLWKYSNGVVSYTCQYVLIRYYNIMWTQNFKMSEAS